MAGVLRCAKYSISILWTVISSDVVINFHSGH